MKPHSPELLAELNAGRVDYRDAVELVFDSGVVRLVVGVKGSFGWSDLTGVSMPWAEDHGDLFHGGGDLIGLDVPENALGPESQAITAKVFETYMVEGSDVPVNVFDDGVRATIDEEPWEGRPAVLSVFWFGAGGTPILREQVAVRTMDQMVVSTDEAGNPIRALILEEPDIMQRDIEGKTANAAFQALIDPTDKAFEHVATAQRQKISFGRLPEETVA